MRKYYTILLAALISAPAFGQDLVFDPSFNNGAAYRDDLPALLGVGIGNIYYQEFGRMKRVNDSVFVYFINVDDYDNYTYDNQVRAIISHSDGTASHEQVFSATGSYAGGNGEDWAITDIITNPSNGHIYIVQNGLYDDSGTTRGCINVHGRIFDNVNSNFQNIPLWGQNQSGMTEVSLSGYNLRNSKGTIMAGVPYLAMNVESNQSFNVGVSAVVSSGQGFSFTFVTSNAASLYSSVSDIVAISSTEVFIADNAYTYTYVNPNAQINDYARILKFNPTTGMLDQTYGSSNGIASITWNSQSNTNFVQDQIKRILYVGGDLYVAGYSREDIGAQYTPVHGKVTKLNSAGIADNSFASTGTFAPDYSSTRFATFFNDIDLASDGSIYLSGSGSVTTSPNDPSSCFILAINDDGTVQTTKGTNGFLFENLEYVTIKESIIIPGTSTLSDKFVFNGYYTSMPAETAVGRLVWDNGAGLTATETSEMMIYPNPVEDVFTIQTQSEMTIDILNIQGEVVQSLELTAGTNSISVESLSSGMYFIQTQEAHSKSARFIKQ